MFLKGLWDQHRAQKWNREQLRKSFGKAGRTEYADGELNGIVRYFEKHPKDFQIDDITWNDLNLDEIFLRMNSTCSSAGQEYLYAMLRSPSFEEKELQEREKLLEFLEQDEETRVRMQEIFSKSEEPGNIPCMTIWIFWTCWESVKTASICWLICCFSCDRSSFCQSAAWIVWCECGDVF